MGSTLSPRQHRSRRLLSLLLFSLCLIPCDGLNGCTLSVQGVRRGCVDETCVPLAPNSSLFIACEHGVGLLYDSGDCSARIRASCPVNRPCHLSGPLSGRRALADPPSVLPLRLSCDPRPSASMPSASVPSASVPRQASQFASPRSLSVARSMFRSDCDGDDVGSATRCSSPGYSALSSSHSSAHLPVATPDDSLLPVLVYMQASTQGPAACYSRQSSGDDDDDRSLHLNATLSYHCSGLGLTRVPAPLSSAVEFIHLGHNNITNLGPTTFYRLPVLLRILLPHNRISAIVESAFVNLRSLTNLSLSSNLLTAIAAHVFDGMPSLQYLYLEDNLITSIDPEAFSSLLMLAHLELQYNLMTSISPATFNNLALLQHLDLSINKLRYLPSSMLRGLRDLSFLDLSANSISAIPPAAFVDTTALQSLNLAHNVLSTIIVDALAGLEFLQVLNIAANRFSGLAALKALPSLQILYAMSNALTTVPADLCSQSLQSLDLSYNLIASLPLNAFGCLLSLRSLCLDSNILTVLAASSLTRLSALIHLDIGHNPLRTLSDRVFAAVPRLQYLGLQNISLRVNSSNLFIGLSALQTLDMSHNMISQLPPAIFAPLLSLRSLYLGFNRMEFVNFSVFQNLTEITELDLSHNHLFYIGVGFFDFLPPATGGWVQSLCSTGPYSLASGPGCPPHTTLLTIDITGNGVVHLSRSAFHKLPSYVRVILSSPVAPLLLPSCCGLEWLADGSQVIVMSDAACRLRNTTQALNSFPSGKSICPCKQWHRTDNECYSLQNWTVQNGDCVNIQCPGCSLYPTGSSFTCVDRTMNSLQFTMFETAYQECLVTRCADCSKSVSTCRACSGNYSLLDQSRCVETCPDTTFAGNGSCIDCVPYCQHCRSALKCDRCVFGYGLGGPGSGCTSCSDGCSCLSSPDTCIATCLGTGQISADCNPSRSTPTVAIAVSVSLVAVVLGFTSWLLFKFIRKTKTLADYIFQTDELRNSWKILLSELILLERIGEGSYGEVYKGQWRQYEVAVKVYSGFAEDLPRQQASLFEQEIEFVRTLRNPNVVLFLGAGIIERDQPFLVMEYVEGGSLAAMLQRHGPLPWSLRVKMMLGAAKGMAYLHDKQRMHRDLNSNNLLVQNDTLLVADFGISSFVPTAPRAIPGPRQRTGHTGGVGTLLWMAPELLDSKPYDLTVDVYSYAIVMWEMAAKSMPTWERIVTVDAEVDIDGFIAELTMRLKSNQRLPIDRSWPTPYVALMEQCWRSSPKERPAFYTVENVLQEMLTPISHQEILAAQEQDQQEQEQAQQQQQLGQAEDSDSEPEYDT